MLKGKCVVLGVTGGIAAYKACEIVSRLKKLGANVLQQSLVAGQLIQGVGVIHSRIVHT